MSGLNSIQGAPSCCRRIYVILPYLSVGWFDLCQVVGSLEQPKLSSALAPLGGTVLGTMLLWSAHKDCFALLLYLFRIITSF